MATGAALAAEEASLATTQVRFKDANGVPSSTQIDADILDNNNILMHPSVASATTVVPPLRLPSAWLLEMANAPGPRLPLHGGAHRVSV
jgi:hypothetical protein